MQFRNVLIATLFGFKRNLLPLQQMHKRMNNYGYLNVSDLIGKGFVTNLHIGMFGFAHLNSGSVSFFEATRDANINAYYFLLVEDGQAVLDIDLYPTDVQKQDLLLLNPFSIIRPKEISSDFFAMCLFIDRTVFERIPNYSRFHGLVNRTGTCKIPLDNPSFGSIGNTLSVFSSYLNHEHTFQEGLTLVLSDFLLLQINEELHARLDGAAMHIERKDGLVQRFFNLIADHHREQHDLQFYASRLCVSTTYLSRIVRETTHRTAYHYIAEKLFLSSRHLLACTDYTVAEVASQMHFSDQSAFGKFFKSKAGVSPALYRKKLGKE